MKKTLLILFITFTSILTYAQPPAFNGAIPASNESAVIYGDMTIMGSPADDGDWIAAFDEQENLVGVAELSTFAGQAVFLMTLYGGTDQLTNGEMFVLRGWDASTNTYYTNGDPEVKYGPWSAQQGGGYLPGYGPDAGGLPNFTIDFSTVLPIELSKFGVQKRSCDKFTLEWITQSEINNEFFSIQRSIDDINSFETIAKMDGAGDSNSERIYNYEDEINLNKNHTVYYRLKQTDYDGKSSYSDIILTNYDCGTTGRINIFPNPFTTEINLEVSGAENSRITVLDAQGNLVYDSKNTSQNGSRISTTDWPNGLYIARNIVDGILVESQKIIKQN